MPKILEMKNETPKKLIFVYNADSGLRNALLDSAHKIFSPSTYECNLCDITYGAFTEQTAWKNFRKETRLNMEFLHKDEFLNAYGSKITNEYTFPIILIASDILEIFATTDAINGFESAEQLIDFISSKENTSNS